MKRTGCLFASMLLSISMVLTSPPAHAQALADRIPQDAVAYVGWSGSESMGPGYAGSHLKAVIEASNLAQLASESFPGAEHGEQHEPRTRQLRERDEIRERGKKLRADADDAEGGQCLSRQRNRAMRVIALVGE